jgi:uncharacterized membrane protein
MHRGLWWGIKERGYLEYLGVDGMMMIMMIVMMIIIIIIIIIMIRICKKWDGRVLT